MGNASSSSSSRCKGCQNLELKGNISMGNASSSSSSSSLTHSDLLALAAGATKPTMPSDAQVDHVLRALRDTFERTVDDMADSVDKTTLFVMLRSKLDEEYPFLAAEAAVAVAGANKSKETDSIPAHLHKKQKTDDAEAETDEPAPSTTTIYPRNSLQGQAFEVLANIAGCLNRTEYNNFALTCKRVDRALTSLVEPPWPLKCPFNTKFYEESDIPPELFFSNDGTRVAIVRENRYDASADYSLRTGKVEVWDRSMGFLGVVVVPTYTQFCLEPVFSPDAQLLILYPNNKRLQVCQLPSPDRMLPIAVFSNLLNDIFACSISFIDNNTICFMEYDTGLTICKINRDNNRISFGEPIQATLGSLPNLTEQDTDGRVAYNSTGRMNNLLAFTYYSGDETIIFHDRKNNATVMRPIPSNLSESCVLSLKFTQDGSHLVVSHYHDISVICCDVENIEDIGQSRALGLNSSDMSYSHLSSSPNPSKMAVASYTDEDSNRDMFASRLQIIDIEHGQILSDGWNDSTWKTFVS